MKAELFELCEFKERSKYEVHSINFICVQRILRKPLSASFPSKSIKLPDVQTSAEVNVMRQYLHKHVRVNK